MKNKSVMGRVALLSTTLIWGTSFVVLKNTLNDVGTLWVIALRFIIASLLLLFFSAKRFKKMTHQQIKGSIYLGICLAAAYILQTYGLFYTTPGKNAFLTATYCVLVPFLAWGVYDRKPGIGNIIAAFLCFVGIGFVSLSGLSSKLNLGDALTVICGLFYAIQIILMEQYCGDGDTVVISEIQFAVAALICLAGALLFEPFPAEVPASAWISILYMGVMCTAVCFFLQAWGIKYTPSSTAAVILTLESVFGAVFSVLFYKEKLSVKLIIGFILIFASVLISELGPKNKQSVD